MELDTFEFFSKLPQALPLFQEFAAKVLEKHPDVRIRVQKSQITFSNKYQFAFVWLPVRKVKNRPVTYIVVTFGLSHRLDSPRILEAVQPYPNRWTHHLLIQSQSEIDSEVMKWIEEAYEFAVNK